jgi:hypothetical protein
MSWAGAALEAIAESLHSDSRAEALRVHFFGGRREEVIDAELFERGAIGFQVSRILLKVFGWAELFRVYEKRDDYRGTAPQSLTNEREVAFVERAHRGDEAKDAFFCARVERDLLHPGNGVDRFHVVGWSRPSEDGVAGFR